MNIALAADAFLALLILGLAIWTIAVSATYGAVVGFVAYGLLMALVWVRPVSYTHLCCCRCW